MPNSIKLKAGKTITIYRRIAGRLPMDIHFDAIALDEHNLAGEVTVFGSNWLFPKPPLKLPLQARNTVHAGFWDTFFRVVVTAHTDLEIVMPGPDTKMAFWIVGVAFIVITLAGLIFLLAQ
jgi:hypothetical protein